MKIKMNWEMLLSGFLLLLVGLTACRSHETKVEESVPVATPTDVVNLNDSMIRQIGLQVTPVLERPMQLQLSTVAQVKADENRVFHINSFVAGRVIQDNVQLGSAIRQGQTLAMVQNLDVAKIQAESIHQLHQNEIDIRQAKIRLHLAEQNLLREKRLLTEGISPRRDYLQAEAEATLARSTLAGQQEHAVHLKEESQALLNAYGMTPRELRSEKIHTGSPVVAPRSGIVTKKAVTLGDMVTPEMVMYEVADLSQVWLDLTLFTQDVSKVKVGDGVSFSVDNLPGQTLSGKISYIQPNPVDASNTYIARVFLQNMQNQLKPGMLGRAKIVQPNKLMKPFVPDAAVQRYGREAFVFVPLNAGQFQKRVVQLGVKTPEGYWVQSGLKAGESVVTQGAFTLKAELLKHQFAEEE